ncbi:MAG: methyl-accepting chemotaxis protein [Arcobacteraceae bacterium]
MKNLSLGKKLTFVIISIAVLSLLLSFLGLNFHFNQGKQEIYSNLAQKLQNDAQMRIQARKDIGISSAVSIANNAAIKEALKEKNRELALETLNRLIKDMSDFTSLKKANIHLHTRDNHSFLRSKKPEKFGDDLSQFRHSVVRVNKTLHEVNTFEVGQIGLTLFSTVPIIDNTNEHLGSLDFIQVLDPVVDSFDKEGNKFLLLMDQKVVANVQLRKTKTKNLQFKEYITSQVNIDDHFLEDANQINFSQLFKEKFVTTDQFFYSYIDLIDFQDKKLGIALLGIPIEKADLALENSRSIIELALLIIALLVVFILVSISIFFKKAIIAPLLNFQAGLLDFFAYLNKETKQSHPITISSNDEIGKMAQVVNTNIVKSKTLLDQDLELIEEVKRVANKVKEGKLHQRIIKTTQNESLDELKIILNDMLEITSNNVAEDINKIYKVLTSYANLDFRHKVENDNGGVSKGLNNVADIINQMLLENKKSGIELNNNSNILLENINLLNQNSNEAASALEETAAALEEITSNISSTTSNIIKMSSLASDVTLSVSKGESFANQTTEAMNEIDEEVNSINDAITIIDQIAFQTNILSLNAAVEAATAGEAGKGFAVVAQEVRNLAARSAEAANEIKALVQQATLKADSGKKISAEMTKGYMELNQSISQTIDLIKDVETASKEQLTGIEQINDAVNSLDQQTQQNAMIASQTHDAALEIDKTAQLVLSSANEKEFIGKEK